MSSDIANHLERPDQPEVITLLDALDHYLASLYAPEDNHILDVQALLAPGVRFMVARLNGQAVGCGAVRLMAGEPATAGRPYGEIKRMYVAPAQRGQRVAEQLLLRLEQQLRDEGINLARLETGGEQRQALRLYERCGYTQCAPFGGYPDNGLSLFYAKTLSLQ